MPIPKIIFQTSKNKPEQYIVDKILSKCPNWKYLHYNDEEIIRFFTENYLEEFKDIIIKFNEMPTGAHKADLFRYYYLYINGGVFIDSDAMIELNIENIVKNYDFFSVESAVVSDCIFQGFIGSTPKNIIIYEALKDAYNIDKLYLKNVYHLLCLNLSIIIKNNHSSVNYYLYKERHYNDYCTESYNNDNETILLHYWRYKIIPV